VLCLSTVFPNPAETDFGFFVERRMRRVAEHIPVTVVAPVAVVEYGNPQRKFPPLGRIPKESQLGALQVYYPRYFYPPLGGWVNGFFLAGQVCRTLSKLEFDLIDSHFAHPDGVAAAVLARMFSKPYVVTLRGNETDHAVYAPRRRAMAWALRGAARVLAVSERLRRFAIELGCDAGRVITTPNGIDGSVFFPRERQPQTRKVILSAGYLVERKGHHRVAEALRMVVDSGVEAELWIAGGPGREGEFEAEIRAAVAGAGVEDRTRFLGAVKPERLADLMSNCDVFALASRNEGWPNVVHEAMGCGAPVVATDIGAINEMIPDERFGYVVPFGEPAALAGALRRALTREWDRKAISDRALARSWDNVGAEVAAILKEAIAEHQAKEKGKAR
jgi:glycosyltransferase involved in cell wall biosynthesis